MNERLQRLKPYPMVRLDQLKAEVLARGQTVHDFGTGDPREPTPGFIREACLAGLSEVSQYPKVTGLPAARQSAAGYLQRRFGVEVDPDHQLLPTQGSKEAIFHLPMTFLDPTSAKNRVVYGVPAYPVFEIGGLFANAELTEVPLTSVNRYLLDPQQVGADVLAQTAMVFLNYPHNPTGQLMPPSLFEQWVQAQRDHGFVLVSDECYVDLYYEGVEPPHSLLEFAGQDFAGCLAVHSLSKRSGMTGYRSGFVAGDAQVVAQFRRFRAGMGVAPTDMVQHAAAAAWADAVHVEERRRLFEAKRRVFVALFERLGLAVYDGPSTLFLWVQVPPGRSDVAYAEELLQQGILASPGSFFGPGQEGFFRLALVPSLEECEAAAKLWPML